MTKHYNKFPTTVQQQIELLKSRNMLVADELRCTEFLSRISYYKIRGYWLNFENNRTDGMHQFKNNVYLDTIIDAYDLDFHMRPFIFKMVSELEISIKGLFVNLSNFVQPEHLDKDVPQSHFYLSKSLFDSGSFEANLENIATEFAKNKSKLLFIDSYKEKYNNPKLPPVWSAVELMSFGDIAKWIRSLSDFRYSDFMTSKTGWTKPEFDNFLFMTTIVRNMCAHHSRLFDTIIYGTPKYPKQIEYLLNKNRGHKLWNSFIMILHVLFKLKSSLIPII